MDKGRIGEVVFLDFNKSSNTVSIKSLIWKQENISQMTELLSGLKVRRSVKWKSGNQRLDIW